MIDRRKFLNYSLGTAALLSTNLKLSTAKTDNKQPLNLKIYATNWGFKGDIEHFCQRVKAEGYDGIEVWLPEKNNVNKLLNAIDKYELELILLVAGHEKNFDDNFASFKSNLERALSLSPRLINCHTGRDYFTFEQASQFFNETIKRSAQTGINITHETHRARILFAAHISEMFLQKFPALRLTLDISHWCNVASSLLADQTQAVNLALAHSDHVHSRVGFAHGPQVNDPRAPEWKTAFNAHVAWWDKVVALKRQTTGQLTMTTEFGPAPYMPTLPYTNQPVADQWAINRYMMSYWRERYAG